CQSDSVSCQNWCKSGVVIGFLFNVKAGISVAKLGRQLQVRIYWRLQSTSDTAVYLSSEEVVGTGSVAYGYSGIEGAKRLVGMFIMDYVDRCT
ncbi:hypothetical protein, partial [Marinobacter sp.]